MWILIAALSMGEDVVSIFEDKKDAYGDGNGMFSVGVFGK